MATRRICARTPQAANAYVVILGNGETIEWGCVNSVRLLFERRALCRLKPPAKSSVTGSRCSWPDSLDGMRGPEPWAQAVVWLEMHTMDLLRVGYDARSKKRLGN